MALTLDTVNSQVAQLAMSKGGEVPLYATNKPLMVHLRKIAKPADGLRIKRQIVVGASRQGTNLTGDGFNIAPAGVSRVMNGYELDYAGFLFPVDVAQKALDEASDDPAGVMGLVHESFGATASLTLDNLEYWICTGAPIADPAQRLLATAAQFFPLQSFNGNVTWQGVSGTDGGLFQLAAQASQTGNVQNVARSTSHSNQYGVGTGWASGTTRSTLSYTINRCNQFASGTTVDFGLADPVSASRLEDSLMNSVRTVNVEKDIGTNRSYILFNDVKIFSCVNLDTENASYTGTTAASASAILGGVIYLMPTAHMEFLMSENGVPKLAAMRPDQAVLSAQMKPRLQILTGRLPSIGAVAGTRIP